MHCHKGLVHKMTFIWERNLSILILMAAFSSHYFACSGLCTLGNPLQLLKSIFPDINDMIEI